jgi:hypothetical protein
MSLLPDHWFYNTETGALTKGNDFDNLGNNLLGGLGWHELNVPGSDTEAQAAAAAQKEFPTGKPPTTSIVKAAEQDNPVTSDAASVASFLGSLSNSGTWVRVLKVVIGGVLVVVGFARLTGAGKAVTSTVKAVAK